MQEIQEGDKVTVKHMLHGMPTREYIVVKIDGDDVLLRTVRKEIPAGQLYWEATHNKNRFQLIDGKWRII